jgi:signal transduction histidine kinase
MDEPDGMAGADEVTDPPDESPARVGSVRVRITAAASLVTAAAVALAGWLLIRSVEDTQTGEIHDRIERYVDIVADRLSDDATLESAVEGIPMVTVRSATGDLLISNPRFGLTGDGQESTLYIGPGLPTGGDAGAIAAPPAGAGEGVVIFRDYLGEDVPTGVAGGSQAPTAGAGGGDRLTDEYVLASSSAPETVTREIDTAQYGRLSVTALAPVDEVARSVSAVSRALWMLLPALVGVVALVAWWLVGRALRPVESIRLQAESIGGTTIHRRLPEPASDDEIGRLARTMNAMLGRLDQSARRQRQFVSDASHELRSPVAAIRTDLEVALHEGDRADWPTVARAVLAEEGRLETLLGDLLVLASDDEAAAAQPHATTVDMAQLASDEVARCRRVPIELEVDGGTDREQGDELVVEGVAARLDRALANLVDNAARHAESEVRLTVRRRDDRVRVVVDDDGPGISVADRERIFERFTRLDGSRSRDRGGAGLGLAVVRSIATRHNGFVWADTGPLGGARFILDLPAARPQAP